MVMVNVDLYSAIITKVSNALLDDMQCNVLSKADCYDYSHGVKHRAIAICSRFYTWCTGALRVHKTGCSCHFIWLASWCAPRVATRRLSYIMIRRVGILL